LSEFQQTADEPMKTLTTKSAMYADLNLKQNVNTDF